MINDLMIRSFLTVAETLNFTNAAKQLYLSQQAVSKHIAKLEEVLGCRLFSRARGNISLTPAGKIFFNVFSDYEQNLAAAKILVRNMDTELHPRLVIGHLEMLDIHPLLYPVIKRFKELYPDVVLEFKSCLDWELPILLREDQIDLAITFSPEMGSDERNHIRHLLLDKVPELLVVSKDHPLAQDDSIYTDFQNENVFFALPPSGNIKNLLTRMDMYHFPYENLVCTDNMSSSFAAVDMMQGVTFAVAATKLLHNASYKTYPTGIFVNIIACYKESSPKKEVRQFCDIITRLPG